jgi:arylsulfatase A-like enzyme
MFKYRHRIPFAVGSTALAVSSLAANPSNEAEPPIRPNVILILCDDLTRQAMSCYGGTMMPTPQMDRMAKDGARFEKCFVSNSICSPSRAVILTGKYSHLNGVRHNREDFNGAQQTFPKLLQAAGYQTAVIGKWHLHTDPTGFDFWQVLPGQGAYWNPEFLTPQGKIRKQGYVTTILTDDAIRWIGEQRDPSKPFYLQIGNKAPHSGWEPDKKYEHLFDGVTMPEPPSLYEDLSDRSRQVQAVQMKVGPEMWKGEKSFSKRYGAFPEGLNERETRSWVYQRYIKDYLRCVASVDENLGRLLDYLDQSGLSKNTVVMFTSDQGFFLGEHGFYDKRLMYDEPLSTPLLMRCSGVIPDCTVQRFAMNLDFAETILDFAGAPIPADMQGVSLRPLVDSSCPKPASWRDAIYYRYYDPAFGLPQHEGIRTDRYKLIHFLAKKGKPEAWEFYDLQKDPREAHNAYREASPEVIQRLVERMKALRTQYKVPADDADMVF